MRIEIQGVSIRMKKRYILHDIQLNIQGVYGLIGPNGAGKTTLMKFLAGLIKAENGSVLINGEEYLTKKYIRSNSMIGYLPQEFMVYPDITVYDVLNHIAVLQGIGQKQERHQLIMEVLEKVNLLNHEYKKMNELSGGMRRRVGIAQLLMRKPSILLFDEPTAGLDIEERIRFRNLLKSLSKSHMIIISSHIVEDIEFLCTKIGVLKEGQMVFEGSPEELNKQAQGFVYEKDVAEVELDELMLLKNVVQIKENGDFYTVRLFSTQPEEGEIVKPQLIDGYLAIVRGEKHGIY
ncbi:ATP-binding cassette domain-containing protein [Metalysinibacillus jejuensis]|uniref:ATP-binding cassette domain-containing protein n=1 Tax=Metalysinibacillus jejuensis TaxID=914327 RepID=UPI000D34E6ED|nr:ATP-binding cassette domain-containing protein [Metalysinibacillus jejuensis]